MKLEKYNECSKAARKLIKADLVLKNASIVNVFTESVEKGSVAIKNGMIVGIGDYEGEKEIDIGGRYVTSGFINSHLHLESTMVNPQVMIAEAAKHGTTTLIAKNIAQGRRVGNNVLAIVETGVGPSSQYAGQTLAVTTKGTGSTEQVAVSLNFQGSEGEVKEE